jgi:hypothetical protein
MQKKRLFFSFLIPTIFYWLMISLLDYSETKVSYWQDLKANALPALAFGVFVTIVNWGINKYEDKKGEVI